MLAGQWFVDIDFKNVEQICSGCTTPQAKQFLHHYLGKRTEITGILADIRESAGPGLFPTQVYLHIGVGDRRVGVSIDVFLWNWSFKGIRAFPRGTIVTVSGRITDLAASSLFLSGCELIKAEPPVIS